jgi:hypothetical protein
LWFFPACWSWDMIMNLVVSSRRVTYIWYMHTWLMRTPRKVIPTYNVLAPFSCYISV